MLKTQTLFKTLGYDSAVEFLKADPRNIQVKEYDNFIVLNYNQVFSKDDDEYVMECRSLQLDKQGNVISRAFPRFFNYGQLPEITGKFDFDSAAFYEKADGSMIRVYWNPFDDKWEIATRGTAFAESEQDFYPTFRQAAIEDGFGLKNEEEFQSMCKLHLFSGHTFVFEYCSLKNCIVTPYKKSQMVLLAVIDNETGKEKDYEAMASNFYSFDWFYKTNVRLVKRYQFSSKEEMQTALETLPDLQEGFVAQDKNGLRVKFKNSLYMKLHKMRGDLGFTEKKIAEIVAEGEEDEVLVYFSQYKHLFDPIVKARDDLFSAIITKWGQVSIIKDKKEFAMKVKDLEYSALLFSMNNKGKTFDSVWNESRLEYRTELILNGLK